LSKRRGTISDLQSRLGQAFTAGDGQSPSSGSALRDDQSNAAQSSAPDPDVAVKMTADTAEAEAGRAVQAKPSSEDATDLTPKVSTPAPSAQSQSASAQPTPSVLTWRLFLSGSSGLYGRAVLATVAINVLALVGSLVVMNVYDRVLPNQAMETLTALAMGAVLAAIFEFSLRMLRGVMIDAASHASDVKLANMLFERVVGAKLSLSRNATGVRLNTMREFETLRDFFTSATMTVLGDLPFTLLFIIVIGVVAGPLVIVPLVAMPLLIAGSLMLHRPLAKLTAESFRDTAQKNAILVETLIGLETIKTLGAETWASRLWNTSVREHVRVGLRMRLLSGLAQNLVGLVQGTATVALLVYGVILVGRGEISAGGLMAAMTLMARLLAPVAQGALILSRLHQVKIVWTALRQLTEAPQERPESADFVRPEGGFTAIRFEDVSFAYAPDAQPALQQVSFSIEAGERVGIIGTIGCGKSTMLKLMLKLYEPQGGRILANGLALNGVDPAQLRRCIGFVEQAPTLFSGTIRSNLVLNNPDASDAQILRACEISGALNWIGRLPRGFDTPLGERGGGLSSGQRQSLAIARALVNAPSILLMDEPTSDMDGRSEADIVRRIASALTRETLILVTHRPALLELVDRLIVIDNGRVFADGTKAKVLDLLRLRHDIQEKEARARATSVATVSQNEARSA
jgi:ATP-binding cassette, subfamily C, bacterial LapB